MNPLLLVTLATKLPGIIAGAVHLVDDLKGFKGSDKKKQVIEKIIPEALDMIEAGAGKDLFNDPAIAQLISAYNDAEAAVLKARNALQQGILNKAHV